MAATNGNHPTECDNNNRSSNKSHYRLVHRRAHNNGNSNNSNGNKLLPGPDLRPRRRRRRKQQQQQESVIPVVALVLILTAVLAYLVVLTIRRFVGNSNNNDDDDHGINRFRRGHNQHNNNHNNNHNNRRNAKSPIAGEAMRVQELPDLPFAQGLYRHKDAHPKMGDRSLEYAALRQAYDKATALETLPNNNNNNIQAVRHTTTIGYDIYNCPVDAPPDGYPFAWRTLDILDHWPVNTVDVPMRQQDKTKKHDLHHSLCVFHALRDAQAILLYRELMLPFVVTGDPSVQQAAARWSTPGYVANLMGAVKHRAERSESNHFMYYIPVGKNHRGGGGGGGRGLRKTIKSPFGRPPPLHAPEGWTEPTQMIRMTYSDWFRHANQTEPVDPDSEHYYFRLIGCGATGPQGECDAGSSEYLFDELPFFQPVGGNDPDQPNHPSRLYIVDPDEQKGIHCRFGMEGCIAENHFDGSRNAIVVLSGQRRYILSHPNQCNNLALYPKGHPSARHSAVDWSDPDLEEYPMFADAMSSEIVLQAGQVLYLPTNWFHFIVSLGLNYQCNTRSGTEKSAMHYINECGF